MNSKETLLQQIVNGFVNSGVSLTDRIWVIICTGFICGFAIILIGLYALDEALHENVFHASYIVMMTIAAYTAWMILIEAFNWWTQKASQVMKNLIKNSLWVLGIVVLAVFIWNQFATRSINIIEINHSTYTVYRTYVPGDKSTCVWKWFEESQEKTQVTEVYQENAKHEINYFGSNSIDIDLTCISSNGNEYNGALTL